jgi:hypothetical protein
MIAWLKKLFTRKKSKKILIWGIVEGPIHIEDIPDSPYEDGEVLMVLKVSLGKTVMIAEFVFDDLNKAYFIVEHFTHSIEPMEIDAEDFELVE